LDELNLSTPLSRILYGRVKKKKLSRTPALVHRDTIIRCPQIRALVVERRQVTPRKPNSALRKCVKVMLTNCKYLVPYVPGGDHNLRKFGECLVRGGGSRDLPGVRYSCIRGVLGLFPVSHKTKRRSIYGVKQPSHMKKMRKKHKKYYAS
jgi:small subunit ribosomal protein S12